MAVLIVISGVETRKNPSSANKKRKISFVNLEAKSALTFASSQCCVECLSNCIRHGRILQVFELQLDMYPSSPVYRI